MQSFTYEVKDELGIHARPAGLLAKEVKNYACKVTLVKGNSRVPANGVMGIMMLNVKKGDNVCVEMEGEDEEAACKGLLAFFQETL